MLCQFLLYNGVNELYVYIYPLCLGPPSPPPSHPSRSLQSTELSSLCYTAGSYQLSILHMVVYICQSQSPNSYPSMSTCRFSTSASLFLPYKQVHLYHFSRFHIFCEQNSLGLCYEIILHCVWVTPGELNEKENVYQFISRASLGVLRFQQVCERERKCFENLIRITYQVQEQMIRKWKMELGTKEPQDIHLEIGKEV